MKKLTIDSSVIISSLLKKKQLHNIVANPGICQGESTFRGTRILVADVLDQIANGMDWVAIIVMMRKKNRNYTTRDHNLKSDDTY